MFERLPAEHRAIATFVLRAAQEECPPETCGIAPELELAE